MLDLAIINAKVWTGPEVAPAEAIGAIGERIVAVGDNASVRRLAGPATTTIDAAGRLVIPGFNDGHLHLLSGGRALLGIDLRGARDERQFADMLAAAAQKLPAGRWILGGQWDHESWPSHAWPTRDMIDAVTPGNPVLVRRLCGHIGLANAAALKLAGITRDTPDPEGGRIVRDATTGEPTGVLIDMAMRAVYEAIPKPNRDEQLDAARAALRHAAEMGVTSMHDMGVSAGELGVLQDLRRSGELTVRVNAVLADGLLAHARELGRQSGFGDSRLRVGAVKLFADGSLGAGSALLLGPYADRPESAGLAIQSRDELIRRVCEIDVAGLQVALHAIGDKAVRWALNAFEAAAAKSGRRDARHRVEHAQIVQPDDRRRFAELGVVASIQPCHCTDDMRWIERRLGPRCEFAYPHASLLAAGATVAMGTDWPVEPLNPMLGIHAAVVRERPDGSGPAGGWHPDERVSMDQALSDYTLGSVYAEFQEAEKGVIAPGKLADLVILSTDLLSADPAGILETRSDVTIFGGKVIHRREGR